LEGQILLIQIVLKKAESLSNTILKSNCQEIKDLFWSLTLEKRFYASIKEDAIFLSSDPSHMLKCLRYFTVRKYICKFEKKICENIIQKNKSRTEISKKRKTHRKSNNLKINFQILKCLCSFQHLQVTQDMNTPDMITTNVTAQTRMILPFDKTITNFHEQNVF